VLTSHFIAYIDGYRRLLASQAGDRQSNNNSAASTWRPHSRAGAKQRPYKCRTNAVGGRRSSATLSESERRLTDY